MKKITLLITAILLCGAVFAQAPQSFGYQAVARDLSGNLLANRTVSFKVSILSGSTSGTTVYSETHNKTTNTFGLVDLEIGKGTAISGTFSTISWGTNLYFVKIEMDPNGGTAWQFLGASQLLSVPYALHAKTADNFSTPQWTTSGSNIYYNNGNVGIGTSNPITGLDVNGIITATGGNSTNWNTAYGWGNHTGLYKPVNYMPLE